MALKRQFPYAVINVIVTAVGGESSKSGSERFEQDVLALRPDIVTIDYGLNDRELGLEDARKAWETMITRAHYSGVKVLLMTPTPDISARLDDPADPLNQHAEQIRTLAQEYHVGLIDSMAAFSDAVAHGRPLPSLMSQKNHPNRQGHELVLSRLIGWFPDTVGDESAPVR